MVKKKKNTTCRVLADGYTVNTITSIVSYGSPIYWHKSYSASEVKQKIVQFNALTGKIVDKDGQKYLLVEVVFEQQAGHWVAKFVMQKITFVDDFSVHNFFEAIQ